MYRKEGEPPFAALIDGTPLYPAWERRLGEQPRQMGSWDGSMGEWVGVTEDGHLYRQRQLWSGDEPRPDRWRRFRLAGGSDA